MGDHSFERSILWKIASRGSLFWKIRVGNSFLEDYKCKTICYEDPEWKIPHREDSSVKPYLGKIPSGRSFFWKIRVEDPSFGRLRVRDPSFGRSKCKTMPWKDLELKIPHLEDYD